MEIKHNKPSLDMSQFLDMQIRDEPQASLEHLLSPHNNIFVGKQILDLGCYTGNSTNIVKKFGAKSAIGVDFRPAPLALAKKHFNEPGVFFLCQDIEKPDLLEPLVNLSDVIITFGTLYHLNNHHQLMKAIAKPHIEYIILDSLYGPETSNTDCYVNFELKVDQNREIIPKYIPNLAWFIRQLEILDFGLDFIERYYTKLNFSNVKDHNANLRMVMRFFNKKRFPSKQFFSIDQVWEWSNDNLRQQIL